MRKVGWKAKGFGPALNVWKISSKLVNAKCVGKKKENKKFPPISMVLPTNQPTKE